VRYAAGLYRLSYDVTAWTFTIGVALQEKADLEELRRIADEAGMKLCEAADRISDVAYRMDRDGRTTDAAPDQSRSFQEKSPD
jgi:hypothetical protein